MAATYETIEILAITFAVLCGLILLVAVMSFFLIRRAKKRAGRITGTSYRLDHDYDGNYETSTYGNKPKIVVTKSTTQSENTYQVEKNGHSKDVTSSYHNPAYERPV